jgi:hypothetical protein
VQRCNCGTDDAELRSHSNECQGYNSAGKPINVWDARVLSRFRDLLEWIIDHLGLTLGLLALSVVLLVVSLWASYRYLVSIPSDYFSHSHRPLETWRESHPALRWSILVGKNVLGVVLIILGLIMLFTPGQGILTLLLGVSLADIPGKRSVERRLIRQPQVLRVVNRMRDRAGKPPLTF